MEAKLRSWWWYIRKHWIARIIVIFLGVIVLIVLGYLFKWGWTGFNGGTNQVTITSTSKGNYTATISQPSKTLWDWLQLLGVLAIPIVVGLGAAWYTAQQGKVSDRENTDNQREAALQAYIDKMSELLLEKNLRESELVAEIRNVARAQTSTVLSRLDGERKGRVLQFLYESRLIRRGRSVVDLSRVDLKKTRLYGAELHEADLRGAYLLNAKLFGADLSDANLQGANLYRAKLTDANLERANLASANLWRAVLVFANLHGADLSHADLNFANLREANLSNALQLHLLPQQ